eukprot:scaffold33479_cov58-Attheya_sp.AAC.1
MAEKDMMIDFGTVLAATCSDRRHLSAHDANVGTGTEVRLEFENDTDKIILNSENDIRLYANFVDQLDCDADSTDTNLLDLDDLDIFLEETVL